MALLRRAPLVVAVAMTIFVIEVAHRHVDAVVFEYLGIAWRPLDWRVHAMRYAAAILPTLWVPTAVRRPSDVGVLLFYMVPYLSFTLLAPHTLYVSGPTLAALLIMLALGLAVVQFTAAIRVPSLPRLLMPPALLRWGLMLATIVGMVILVTRTGSSMGMSFEEVYVRRLAVRDELAAGGAVARYGLATFGLSVVPVAAALGLVGRRMGVLAVSSAAAVLLFAYDGRKTILLMPAYLAALYMMLRHGRKNAGLWFAAAIGGVSAAALLVGSAVGHEWAAGLWSYRFFSGPALTASRYLSFFLDHPHYLFSGGFLGALFTTPYSEPMALFLGAMYAPGTGLNMNTNFWIAAFGDAGLPGLLGASAVVGCLFAVVNALARRGDRQFCSLMTGCMAFVLAESAAQTAFLSGGLLATMVLLYLHNVSTSDAAPRYVSIARRAGSSPH